MVGRKLDARSYTILLLVVVAMLLSLNLFAQMTTRSANVGGRPALTDQQDNYSDAASSAEIAAATREVAAANREIAKAIDRLASAVGKVKFSGGGSTGASVEETGTRAPGGRLEIRDEPEVIAPEFDEVTSDDEAEMREDEVVPYEGTINVN